MQIKRLFLSLRAMPNRGRIVYVGVGEQPRQNVLLCDRLQFGQDDALGHAIFVSIDLGIEVPIPKQI